MKKSAFCFLIALIAVLVISGCTERERRGYSVIPQNAPASWEMTPYGSLQN